MTNRHNQITAIIPFRIDCPERERNLKLVLEYLKKNRIPTLLLEADCKQMFQPELNNKLVDYYFIQDEKTSFHKTHYLNLLAQKCQTPIIAIWDTDVLISMKCIEEAIWLLLQNEYDLCIPYNGTTKFLTAEQTILYEKNKNMDFLTERIDSFYEVIKRPSCGGIVLVKRDTYKSAKGQNEYFCGWGPEDAEFVHRLEILGYKIKWKSSGFLFHLWHPRKNKENYIDQIPTNQIEFIKVCCMDTKELKDYIHSWDFPKS